MIKGKTVVLGVTGSIAAVECVKLSHELRRRGAKVHAVMSFSSQKIIQPYSLEFATGNEVITEITGKVEHVTLCAEESDFDTNTEEKADMFLIAPATANTIGKIARGIDDTTVTTFATTAIGSGIPIVIAPAMHEPMYDHPGVEENIQKLKEWGIEIMPPKIEEDKAKLPSIDSIVTECERVLSRGSLKGKRVIITSGATAESIDPIRIITNRSSGKTGRSLAKEAYIRGAEVTIIHNYEGKIKYANERKVESAEEMIEASLEEVEKGCDIFISAAAISDYTVQPRDSKIKSDKDLVLEMEKVPKLIDKVRKKAQDSFIVGFKAETDLSDEKLIDEARELKRKSNLDLVIGNDANVMGKEKSRVIIIKDGGKDIIEGKKENIASSVFDTIEQKL